ncbi:hypothetical protein RJ640_011522 [Escallonia rubra]|uniref:NAD-dependent epimerase/dehydratase domain-containing protein n=1 Tax=Escallonia rubra TaxID=112253 RepID=A0AA88RUS7_9ASTE|nr:hypothetical protein RJ640_011522 [Escallonia rubra]
MFGLQSLKMLMDWRSRQQRNCASTIPRTLELSAGLDVSTTSIPLWTWKRGREKPSAAFCRKTFTSTDKFEMWGDGLQTSSFTFIDECVEGVLRIAGNGDFREPVNIGSDEMVSMNEMAEMDGLRVTYFWIKEQIEKEKGQGIDLLIYGTSKVVGTKDPVRRGSHRTADGKE